MHIIPKPGHCEPCISDICKIKGKNTKRLLKMRLVTRKAQGESLKKGGPVKLRRRQRLAHWKNQGLLMLQDKMIVSVQILPRGKALMCTNGNPEV